MNDSQLQDAVNFAIDSHNRVGQVRKYTGEPYWNHCQAVANIISTGMQYTPSNEMLAAAWLHDTVEDTGVTNNEIRERFGDVVADYVFFLTDPVMPGVNRAGRKAATVARLNQASVHVKNIKLADMIDNGRSILVHDTHFAGTFIREKEVLVRTSLMDADPLLLNWALVIIANYTMNNPKV